MGMNTNSTQKNKREFLNALSMNSGCSHCGYLHSPASIDFHHIDPTGKVMDISQTPRIMGWQPLVEEVRKTTPLCSNCHNEFEAGQMKFDMSPCGCIEETLDSNPEWRKSLNRSIRYYDRISMQRLQGEHDRAG